MKAVYQFIDPIVEAAFKKKELEKLEPAEDDDRPLLEHLVKLTDGRSILRCFRHDVEMF
jgi:hypothetical protein